MPRYSADREVGRKSQEEIERETARKWAARAAACYARAGRSGSALGWLLRAEDYRHEALEHAALAGDGGGLVGELEQKMAKVRRTR